MQRIVGGIHVKHHLRRRTLIRFDKQRHHQLKARMEVVATYELYNVNRVKLENLIHRVFDRAQLDIEIKDRFGNPVRPREWFLVPIFVVNEVVERIKDGTITQYVYDPKAAELVIQQ